MREYDANLVSRSVTRLGGTSIELVRRRIEAGAPARLHVAHERHAIYAEMSRGFECERQVAGAARERFVSEPGLVSFRPAGSEVRGSTIGEGIVSYGLGADRSAPGLAGRLARRAAPAHGAAPCAPRGRAGIDVRGLRGRPKPPAPRRSRPCMHKGAALALLALLGRPGRARHPPSIASMRGWLRSLPGSTPISRRNSRWPNWAEVAHLSVSQLVRQFRRRLGITPMRHVSNARLKEAQRLLAQTRWAGRADRGASRLYRRQPFHQPLSRQHRRHARRLASPLARPLGERRRSSCGIDATSDIHVALGGSAARLRRSAADAIKTHRSNIRPDCGLNHSLR